MSDNLDIPAFLRIPAARRKAATACKMLIEIMGITGCCNKSQNKNFVSTPRVFLFKYILDTGLLEITPPPWPSGRGGWPSHAHAGPPAGRALSVRCHLIDTTREMETEKRSRRK